ncbi:MAG: MXAN_5187 C-terminal domain-containing protein [Myxococcales bacterium]|nr:MXAN_5187 C-terminal domain-containing protein [Myxococcales bacterium]
MLLSRFWSLALAAAGGAAVAVVLLAQSTLERERDERLSDALRRDRFELELMLKMDARARLDAVADIAAHADVRSALRAATGARGGPGDAEARTRLGGRLRELNAQLEGLAGDMLVAVDLQGRIVAAHGLPDAPAGSGLGAFPLVERALAGYARDDTWVWNGQLYRMAARPVIDAGQYVGAIVHGKRFDDELARRLSERIGGATVAFFFRNRVLARHMPAERGAARAEDIERPLQSVLADERVRQGGRTDPMDVGTEARAVYSLLTGSAGLADAGYAIARPRRPLVGATAILDEATSDDVSALPWPALGGASLGAFLLAMLLFWLERDWPLGKLRRAAAALARREIDRLNVGEFGGAHRKIVEHVNEALDKVAEQAAGKSRKAASLDEILGPKGAAAQAPSFFGFASSEQAPDAVPPAPPFGPPPPLPGGPPPAPRPVTPPGPSPSQDVASPTPPPTTGAALPSATAIAPPAAPPVAVPPRPAARPPAAPAPGLPPIPAATEGRQPPRVPPAATGPQPPAPAAASPSAAAASRVAPDASASPPPATAQATTAPVSERTAGPRTGGPSGPRARPAWAHGTRVGVGDGAGAGLGPVQGRRPAATGTPQTTDADKPPLAAGAQEQEPEEEEGATMVASVPRELLEQSSEGSAEERYFREIYEQFLATKRQCGESVAGLTFDKFAQTLRKNKEQIAARHGAAEVRFTVYVKDGKAALRATVK